MKIAKADLVPTDANLLDAYATFADLEAACEEWTATVNARPHRLLGIPPAQALARELEWVGRRENLCLAGPSGTGKSHYLEALGHHAIDQGLKVTWTTLEDLGHLVRRHRIDDSVAKAITRLLRTDLVVVDDIGLLPAGADAAEAFYRLIDAAYETRSLAISSNIHPARFDELMPTTLAAAGVDRLLHHAHVILTEGDSYRQTEATNGKGVTPLTTP